MQSEYGGKTIYKFTPCKPPGTCMDYEDYDPCESSDDITEKDLAILLKEEKLKLQQEELAKTGTDPASKDKDKNAFTDAVYDEKFSKTKGKGSNNEMKVDEQAVKKRICKKFIKNPFFSNRLKFSASNLPPPPPNPPPQFFPPVEETNSKDFLNCQKRKKKCKKGDDDKKDKKGADDDGSKRGDQDGADGLSGDDGKDDGNDGKNDGWNDYDDGKNAGKKKCRRTSDRPPCRKKDSDVSFAFQPRQIPAAQRDLPPTSPADCPDMIRQIKMAIEHSCPMECSKKKCKKKTCMQ